MTCTSYGEYINLYADVISENTFSRLSWEALRIMEDQTTGADGFRKLRAAYPTDEYDAEAVRRCACELIHLLYQIETAESAAGYVTREDGTVVNKKVASVSSGSESVSYYTGGTGATQTEAAASDSNVRKKMLADTVRTYLSGVKDANGVNLLYMGVYPHVP